MSVRPPPTWLVYAGLATALVVLMMVNAALGAQVPAEAERREVAQVRQLLLGGHAGHEPVQPHRVTGVIALAHPRHGLAAGRLQAPEAQPALHPAGLVGLRRGDVESEPTDGRVVTPVESQVRHLDALQSLGLLRLRAPEPDPTYEFAHSLVQEVVYDSLSRTRRSALHEAVAA